jgi:hypothetical protein
MRDVGKVPAESRARDLLASLRVVRDAGEAAAAAEVAGLPEKLRRQLVEAHRPWWRRWLDARWPFRDDER